MFCSTQPWNIWKATSIQVWSTFSDLPSFLLATIKIILEIRIPNNAQFTLMDNPLEKKSLKKIPLFND